MLYREDFVAHLSSHQCAFINGVLSASVEVLDENVPTVHLWDGAVTRVLEAADGPDEKSVGNSYGRRRTAFLFTLYSSLEIIAISSATSICKQLAFSSDFVKVPSAESSSAGTGDSWKFTQSRHGHSFPSAISPRLASLVAWDDWTPKPCASAAGTRVVSAPAINKRKDTAVSSPCTLTTSAYYPVDIVGPRSSFTTSASVRSSIFGERFESVRPRCAPAAVLYSNYSIAALFGHQSASSDGVLPSLVVSLQKRAFAVQLRNGAAGCVLETTDSLKNDRRGNSDWPHRFSSSTVTKQLVFVIIWSQRAPWALGSNSGAAIVSPAAINERENTAVAS